VATPLSVSDEFALHSAGASILSLALHLQKIRRNAVLYKKLKKLAKSFRADSNRVNSNKLNLQTQQMIHSEIERIKNSPRHQNPKSLIKFGYKMYSQNDEDGIIHEIFTRIGTTNKTFVELGIGDGLENNTVALLFDDWNGLWIDASTNAISLIKTNLSEVIKCGKLKIIESFITKDNINYLISSEIDNEEIDLLSVDIDGNDYHVLHAITCIKPRVIVIEYNAKFPPSLSFCMNYNASHTWKGDDCFGASLKFLENNIDGYCLVGCNVTGANAFFVREDLVADHFLKPFTAENHYEPARYYLAGFSSGHRASYQTLNNSLTMRST
jgi:hypothetical protein